jgi:hypothetical protein
MNSIEFVHVKIRSLTQLYNDQKGFMVGTVNNRSNRCTTPVKQ